MTISGVTTTAQASQSTWMQAASQWRNNFQTLGSALQSGDLSAAQQAFQALQPPTGSGAAPSSTGTSSSTSPLAQDMSALGQALQSGNTQTAQTAFAKLQQDMQAAQQAHHHHHHHATASAAGSATPADGTTGTSTATTSGTTLNVIA